MPVVSHIKTKIVPSILIAMAKTTRQIIALLAVIAIVAVSQVITFFYFVGITQVINDH